MKFRKSLCALILALFSLQILNFSALADEGMWTFNNVPRAEIKKRYGFEITDAWLKKVQLASVRFNNGGSGSFVSPDGLVLTNYHIVEEIVNQVSTPEKDLAKEGFVARTRAEEIKSPSLELNVLVSIEDVTVRVNGAVKAGMPDAESYAARRAEIAAIEDESTKATSRSIKAGNTVCIVTKNIRTCGWFSCLSFKPHFSAVIRTTLTFRASISTWDWCAFMKTASPFIPRVISSGPKPARRMATWCSLRVTRAQPRD